MQKSAIKSLTLATVIAFGLTSCATQQDQYTSVDICNPIVIGAAGAVVGGLLGGKGDWGKGAAIGGLVGSLGCLAVNAISKQTKSASAVETGYKKNKGALPDSPAVVAYQTSVSPKNVVKRGSDVSVVSNMEVVSGTNVPLEDLREEIILIDPSGKEFRRATKVIGDSEKPGSGAYQNTFAFAIPEGGADGIYRFDTQLYLNGAVAQKKSNRVQLVMNDGVLHVAMLE